MSSGIYLMVVTKWNKITVTEMCLNDTAIYLRGNVLLWTMAVSRVSISWTLSSSAFLCGFIFTFTLFVPCMRSIICPDTYQKATCFSFVIADGTGRYVLSIRFPIWLLGHNLLSTVDRVRPLGLLQDRIQLGFVLCSQLAAIEMPEGQCC